MKKRDFLLLSLTFILALTLLPACAEGPLWRTGNLAPWVRDQWLAEEQIADTLFKQKREMNESVANVLNSPSQEQDKVAIKLAEIARENQVLLLRLNAVRLLGELNCPEANDALEQALNDPDPDIRIEAIQSWQQKPARIAITQLQGVIGSDTNTDVRLAATRSLGNFTGENAVRALAMALTDSDPALQVRATESLRNATGQDIGADVAAWQDFVQQYGIELQEKPASRIARDEDGKQIR
ncbi:MAG: HEAT repeat domain-containing protein [Mariniblastus sp.]|nr:HEAT repeat domain-containing protein [Mariniblastus sp.]